MRGDLIETFQIINGFANYGHNMFGTSLRSKRFRLVSEQRNTEEGDFRFWPREKWNESQKVKNTCATFLTVFDSRSSFFSPKLHRNVCYAG